MKLPLLSRFLPVFLTFSLPALAEAHTGTGTSHGLLLGAAHPLTGFDHLCAMIAVGLWAFQLGGRALWAVPLSFVSVMTLGGVLGVSGFTLPMVEPGIAASVLVLGLLIAMAVRIPLACSCLVVAVFALFHGFSHGTEMPETVSGLLYGVGFLAATSLLHLAGACTGLASGRFASASLIRHAGGAIAACGVALFLIS